MPPNMRKTQHGYKYLRAIPAELHSVFKKTVFTKALGRDYKAAKTQVAQLEVESNRLIAEARVALRSEQALDAYVERGPLSCLKSVPVTADLAGRVSALWLSELDTNDRAARRDGLDEDEIQSLDADIAEILPRINRALAGDRKQATEFTPAITQFLQFRGYTPTGTDNEIKDFVCDVLEHMQMGYRVLAARQRGEQIAPLDLSALPAPLTAAWEPSTIKTTVKVTRLSDVTPLFQKHLATSDRKTQTTHLSMWQRLVSFCDDRPLEAVKSDEIYRFLESRLLDKEEPWSPPYMLRAKNVLRQAFSVAKTHNLVSQNPVSQLEILPKISQELAEKRTKPRFPYTDAHLNTLFSSAWYDPDAENWRGKLREDLAARYWVPLICLFHGLRIREVLQLFTHDVLLDGTDVPLVAIQTDSENDDSTGPARHLKNRATKRTVPLHPTLLDLGFLEFLSLATIQGKSRPLFLSSLPEAGSKVPVWGRAYEQAYLRFVRDTLSFGNGYGNHSYRHTLEDQVRDVQLINGAWPPGVSQFYTGRKITRHADRDVLRTEGSEALYGTGYNPSRIRPYIAKISFPKVKLPPPFPVWLGNRRAESAKLKKDLDRWTNI